MAQAFSTKNYFKKIYSHELLTEFYKRHNIVAIFEITEQTARKNVLSILNDFYTSLSPAEKIEIEKEALSKDITQGADAKTVKARIKDIETEIANSQEKTKELEMKWKNEKGLLGEIAKIKKDLETLRVEAENAEQRTDLGRAAEIRYGHIPLLQKDLEAKMARLKKLQKTRRVLKEEITAEDIASVVQPGLDIINLPKPASVAAVLAAVKAIEQAEHHNGVNLNGENPVRLLLNVETPSALRMAFELASAHPRVMGLQLGLADLFEPIAISRKEPFAIRYAMMQVKFAAAEAGIEAFDGAFADIKNTEGFIAEAEFAASIGFAGKSCIHPSQISLTNEAFRPSDAAIAHALKVVEAAREAESKGIGAYVVDGKMIDPPFFKSAQALVANARRLGLIS